jgi:hypothetical protein
MDADRFGIYLPRREWLFAHIIGGTIALLLGPVQLWTGIGRQSMRLHRILGIGYVVGVAVGVVPGFYLAFKTDFGWVVSMGLVMMSTAWTLSTSLAVFAIVRRLIDQHREWMIRSYVVTFSFVTFRLLNNTFQILDLGTTVEQMTVASWFSWSVPLLLTEIYLQGRKILAPSKKPAAVAQREQVFEQPADNLSL